MPSRPLALILAAGAAVAQTSVKLVGNTAQPDSPESIPFNLTDWAVAFTTGSNALGYRLTRVDMQIQDASSSAPVYRVRIRSDSSGSPGNTLGTLTGPGSLPRSAALAQFRASGSGIDLDASTTYFVELDIDVDTSRDHEKTLLFTTWRHGESGAAGWRIADETKFLGNTGFWVSLGGNPAAVIKLDIHGFVRSTDTNPPGPGGPPTGPVPEPEPEPEPEPKPACPSRVTPYWHGTGGFAVRPTDGKSATVRIECAGSRYTPAASTPARTA